MKKKVIILMVLFLGLAIPLQTFAYVWAPEEKTELKGYVRAVGEKMGINWTEKSLNATADYLINKSSFDASVQNSLDMLTYIKNTSFVDGVKTMGVEQADFREHMAMIWESVNDIKEEVDNQPINYTCGSSPKPVTDIPSHMKNWVAYNNGDYDWLVYYDTGVVTFNNGTLQINSQSYKQYRRSANTIDVFTETWRWASWGTGASLLTPATRLLATGAVSGCFTAEMVAPTNYVPTTLIYNLDRQFNSPTTIVYSNDYGDNFTNVYNQPFTEPELKELYDIPDPEPEEKPVGSSWWDWLLKPVIEAVKAISSAVAGLVKTIAGLAVAIAEAIGAIFVPNEGFFDGFFNEIKSTWDSKVPIIGQLSDFMTAVETTSTETAKPVIEVTLPPQYGGVTMSVIDFTYFDQYREWILNFIRFTAWFIFLKRLWARLPRVIGG